MSINMNCLNHPTTQTAIVKATIAASRAARRDNIAAKSALTNRRGEVFATVDAGGNVWADKAQTKLVKPKAHVLGSIAEWTPQEVWASEVVYGSKGESLKLVKCGVINYQV